MSLSTQSNLRAFCETAIERERLRAAEAGAPPLEARPGDAALAAEFVAGQLAAAPDHLRFGMKLLVATLSHIGPPWGRSLDALTPRGRGVRIEAWRASRLGLMRDIVRLCESLTLFWLYSHRFEPAESPLRRTPASGVSHDR